MGNPPVRKGGEQPGVGHWPFDPLQPRSAEARVPEDAKRVQKQTGAGKAAEPQDESPNEQGAKP